MVFIDKKAFFLIIISLISYSVINIYMLISLIKLNYKIEP